ncbi:MAG TPA: glycosyltransferase family 87 protein [Urbifossiella sp.]
MNRRLLLTLTGIALAAVILAGQVRQLLADPSIWPPDDFIEYWAAARLTLDGDNAYDGAKLLPLQIAAGRDTDKAVMMWNPPWSLAIVMPLGLFPAREAQLLWLLVNLAAIGFCGDRLWQMLGGRRDHRWIGWAAALAFLPTLFALQSGQIGPLVLLGAVLFLECVRRGWPVAAGAATLLLAVKPHLAYLVWIAILCDALALRRRGMILGGILAGLIATAIPLAFNPHLFQQYADAMVHRTPDEWLSPTWGSVLRLIFGEDRFKLQFIPMLFGLVWFAWHWKKTGSQWNWTEQLPLLLLVSFTTAPYGAWPFDMVLLLPAAVKLLTLRRPAILAALLAINLGCLAMNLCQTGSFPFLWVSPAMLALYQWSMRPAASTSPSRACPAVAV